MGNSPKLDTLKQSSSGVVGISVELLHVLNEEENPSIISYHWARWWNNNFKHSKDQRRKIICLSQSLPAFFTIQVVLTSADKHENKNSEKIGFQILSWALPSKVFGKGFVGLRLVLQHLTVQIFVMQRLHHSFSCSSGQESSHSISHLVLTQVSGTMALSHLTTFCLPWHPRPFKESMGILILANPNCLKFDICPLLWERSHLPFPS